MKKFTAALLIFSVFFILSCSSTHTFINKDVNAKSRIAVIIGETKFGKESTLYANNFTAALAGGSKLTVLTQNQVKASLGTYPERIQGPYKVIGMEEPKMDYTRHDMDRLAAIAKKLNVQYLYVFWFAQSVKEVSGGNEVTKYWYVGELIEFPSRRIMAQGNHLMFYFSKETNVVGDAPRSIEDMCKIFSEMNVKDIINNTGIAK